MFLRQQVVYIEVFQNRIVLTDSESEQIIEVQGTFSNQRLAIANFGECETQLRDAIGKIKRKSLLHALTFVMHQQVLNDGGLCEIEERVLLELGYGLGARKVFVWQGDTLSIDELKQHKFDE